MPQNEIKFSVRGIPPSVNHYVQHTRSGHHYKTREARAFEAAVALGGRDYRDLMIEATEVEIIVWLGPRQRGDVDDFLKTVLDGMVRARIIRSDATITRLIAEKHRGVTPQTDIYVRWEVTP